MACSACAAVSHAPDARARSKPVPGRAGEANRHLALIRAVLARDAAERTWCTVTHGRTALMVAAMQARRG